MGRKAVGQRCWKNGQETKVGGEAQGDGSVEVMDVREMVGWLRRRQPHRHW